MTKIEQMEEYHDKFENYRREFSNSGWDHNFSFNIDIKFLELQNLMRLEIVKEKENGK